VNTCTVSLLNPLCNREMTANETANILEKLEQLYIITENVERIQPQEIQQAYSCIGFICVFINGCLQRTPILARYQ